MRWRGLNSAKRTAEERKIYLKNRRERWKKNKVKSIKKLLRCFFFSSSFLIRTCFTRVCELLMFPSHEGSGALTSKAHQRSTDDAPGLAQWIRLAKKKRKKNEKRKQEKRGKRGKWYIATTQPHECQILNYRFPSTECPLRSVPKFWNFLEYVIYGSASCTIDCRDSSKFTDGLIDCCRQNNAYPISTKSAV